MAETWYQSTATLSYYFRHNDGAVEGSTVTHESSSTDSTDDPRVLALCIAMEKLNGHEEAIEIFARAVDLSAAILERSSYGPKQLAALSNFHDAARAFTMSLEDGSAE